MNQNRFRGLAVAVAAALALGVGALVHAQGDVVSGFRSVAQQSATGGSDVVIASAEQKQWMW
ncbi:hypothetical protein ACFV8T_21265 [Streptomyces sp. NPDC059832]|uniref:hypothetical protein n=1 Tax=unclassified Streptomyces TaxID=2593676 RepID=UPI00364986D2